MTNDFSCANEFLNNIAYQVGNWPTYGRKESGTGDDYKLELREKTQFFYTIGDITKVITDYKSMRQYPFWSVSEILSEIFAFNPPIMYRYKPETIEWAYKLRADKSMEYMYGRRWNEWNQLLNTIEILSGRRDSKRAVVDIFTPYDTDPTRKDVPCTLMYTFKIRDDKLNMTVFYRSHDLFSGVKYDWILTSFINQLVAMGVNANLKDSVIEPGALGSYEDSLHVYPLKDKDKYEEFRSEAHSSETEERFDIMYQYDTVDEIFEDLWHCVKVEESTYYSNFDFALDKIEKIKNPAFKDFAKLFYNRNAEFLKKEIEKLNYNTKIFRWSHESKK